MLQWFLVRFTLNSSDPKICCIFWYPNQYFWLLHAGGSKQLHWFFLCTLWYLSLSLFLIKSQPVLLTKVSLIKEMQCCFEEIVFSCDFFVCLSCISLGQYFQINIFKSGGFGNNMEGALAMSVVVFRRGRFRAFVDFE